MNFEWELVVKLAVNYEYKSEDIKIRADDKKLYSVDYQYGWSKILILSFYYRRLYSLHSLKLKLMAEVHKIGNAFNLGRTYPYKIIGLRTTSWSLNKFYCNIIHTLRGLCSEVHTWNLK